MMGCADCYDGSLARPGFAPQSGFSGLSDLASDVGLRVESGRPLLLSFLVHLAETEALVVFVKAVAIDVPVTAARCEATLALLAGVDFKPQQARFVTGFKDRASTPFRKAVAGFARCSVAKFLGGPDHLNAFDGRALESVTPLASFLHSDTVDHRP